MDVGKAYLCEVWMLPPDYCNGNGPTLMVMRYAGEMEGGGRTRIVSCGDGEVRFTANAILQLWEPPPGSIYGVGDMGWKIIPLRPLEPDTEDVEAGYEEALVLRHERLLPGVRQDRHLEGEALRPKAGEV